MSRTVLLPLLDFAPETDTFLDEVLAGLSQPQKRIPSKFFYDAHGSHLFDQITELPEYYLTRTEAGIMERHVEAMAHRIGPHALLVEYGSGSSIKTRILLDHLTDPAGYVPIDISKAHLQRAAAALAAAYPGLPVVPVCADYTTDFTLPDLPADNVTVYFPGSTIGNFTPEDAAVFMARLARLAGPGGGLLIGVDLRKDRATLEAAYDDARGVTAAFNKNLLARINTELDGTFDLDAFAHRAFFNDAESRIEMHLMSLADQCVRIGPAAIAFREGETIRTEYSYKYRLEDFAALARHAGFNVTDVWTDEDRLFSVQYLVVR